MTGKRKKFRQMTMLTLSFFVVFIVFLNVRATILQVPGSFSTIQSAIDASSNGDTIVVSPGIYYENINFRGKNIVLTSLYYIAADTSYISSTVINGSVPNNPDTASCVIFHSGEDSTAILQGFTITGGTGTKWSDIHGAGTFREGGGILIELSSPTIRHNIITNNFAIDITGTTGAGGGGIRIGDGNPKIDCNIISCNQGRYGPGIVLNYTGCIIRNNIIYSNTGGQNYNGGSGIWIYNDLATTPKIIGNNTIVDNHSSLQTGTGGVLIWSASNVILKNNIIWHNFPELQIKYVSCSPEVTYCDVEGGFTGTGNLNIDPFFTAQNFYLNNLSPCIDAGDPSTDYNDLEDPGNPENALFPSQGSLRNDIGVYGGPFASLFPSFTTITAIDETDIEKNISIYPNPFWSETVIKTNFTGKNMTLILYNSFGQKIREMNNISGQEFSVGREGLQNGLYFIYLILDNKIIVKDKLIIID